MYDDDDADVVELGGSRMPIAIRVLGLDGPGARLDFLRSALGISNSLLLRLFWSRKQSKPRCVLEMAML